MPPALSFPGVYVQEISSGVRTITGVATSIAAFLGKAVSGPVNDPVMITSFADFERRFGGIARGYPMGYAVRDFYLNGGSNAVIVRLFPGASPLPAAKWEVFGLKLIASSPGTWSNALKVRIDRTNIPVADTTHFNILVRNTDTGATETYVGVTNDDTPNRVDRVLAQNNSVIAYDGIQPMALPTAFHTPLASLPPGGDIWVDAGFSESPDTPVPAAGGDGGNLWIDPLDGGTTTSLHGSQSTKTGLFALDKTDLFNLLCLTGKDTDTDVPTPIYSAALPYVQARRAMLLVDAPRTWNDPSTIATTQFNNFTQSMPIPLRRNAAMFFPRLFEADPLLNNQTGSFPSAGAVAGIMARTDVSRGVWKAPAGTEAGIVGAQALTSNLTDLENGLLNPLGINCLRTFPIFGNVVWGSRTMAGADVVADEYKYLPVRRTALFIEESLFRGLKWVVFEPNDEPLWAQIRLNVGAFMQGLFRQGAFQGTSARDAYFVACDKTTTTQNDINLGIVNVVVGFAPLKPAEFVVLKIQQIVGQIQT